MFARVALGLTISLFSYATFASDRYIPVSGTTTPNMQRFDAAFTKLMRKWNVPGAAVAIVHDNQVVFSHGYGYADLKSQEPVQPDSLFRIASISKAITAVTVMKLIEDEKLHLDDSVFDVLNDISPLANFSKNPKVSKITVRDLLSMTSGWLPSGKQRFDPMFGPWSSSIVSRLGYDRLPGSCYDITRMMMSFPVSAKPGQRFAYSNFDYCVLGLLVNKAAGSAYGYQGYETYVKENILAPLGIHNMYIASTNPEHRRPGEVSYYRYSGPININWEGKSKDLPYGSSEILQKNFANGGWIAAAPDLAKFIYNVGAGNIVSEKHLALMLSRPRHTHSNATKYFGMGLRVKIDNQEPFWYATGSFTGTNALVMRKANGDAIAVVFNVRPPIYHMWRNFRPELQGLLRSDMTKPLLAALALIPDMV